MSVVILEGNISAGKSTLAQTLGAFLNARVFYEPTVTNPYLAKFYQNPKKYGLKMQLYLLRQRFILYVGALRHAVSTGQTVVLDRSIFSDSVFAVTNVEQGNISEEGYDYYSTLRSQMLNLLPIPESTIFLQTDPIVCQQRILSRARSCEAGIPLDYLEALDRNYNNFVEYMRHSGSRVLCLDWNSFGSITAICDKLKQILPIQRSSVCSLLFSDDFVMSRLRLEDRSTDSESSDEDTEEEEYSLHEDVLSQTISAESVAV
ncbi:hypothetical protein GEMRC1_004684 [Eukaryota sp. GEM-RC1]